MRTCLLALTSMLLATAAWAPIAGAASQGATSGRVAATLTWTPSTQTPDEMRDLHLSITLAGAPVVDVDLVQGNCIEPRCTAEPFSDGATGGDRRILVRDLDHNGSPEVLVKLVTEASPAAFVKLLVYSRRGGAYRRSVLSRRTDIRVADLRADRVVEVLTADDRVASRFSTYPDTWRPVQVLRFRGGRFFDVSRAFPGTIRHDAAEALAWVRAECRVNLTEGAEYPADTTPDYAAWAADQYRLRHRRLALRILHRERARGCFFGPRSSTFIPRLDRFLRALYR